MCEAAELWEGPFVIGADFNTTTAQVQNSRVSDAINAKVMAPAEARGTCVASSRTIDFFLVSRGLEMGINEVKVDFNSGLADHRPAELHFHPHLGSLMTRHLRKPPAIAPKLVYGPQIQAKGWERLKNELSEIRDDWRMQRITQRSALGRLDAKLAVFADIAEKELVANTGEDVPKARTRCRGPSVSWKSIIPEKKRDKPHPLAAARWAYHVAKDLAASTVPVSSGKRDSLLAGHARAVEDAAEDEDLALQVGRLVSLCEDCVNLDLASVTNRASSLKTLFACASDIIREKEKASSLKGWKNWLDDDADKGCRRAQQYSKLPEA
jgi:hypothetical protein